MDTIPLRELSIFDLSALSLKDALRVPDRARTIEIAGAPPNTLLKIKRVMRLTLGGPVPEWIGKLRHLRSLTLSSRSLKQVPAFVFELPKLRSLALDDSGVTGLNGLERAKTLESVTFNRTPLGKNKAEQEAIVVRVPNATRMGFMTGISIERPMPPAPKTKAKLIAALQADELDDELSLHRADLSGGVFEDLVINQDLQGANLANTVWRRCEIGGNLAGSTLTGATFEDCVFGSLRVTFSAQKIKAARVTFRRCSLDLNLTGSDLTGARFLELEPSPILDLTKASARGMQLAAEVFSESDIEVTGPSADLRGATIVFDVTAERRAELAKKPTSGLKWGTGTFRGAKTDDTTRLIYQPLPDKRKKPGFRLDELGPRAESIGRIDAINAGLWLLIMDGAESSAWRGSQASELNRALGVSNGVLDVGTTHGVIAGIGDCGWSFIWRLPDGIALIDHYREGPAIKPTPAAMASIGARVAQFPVYAKPTRIGRVTVRSGCVALLLPYTDGDFTPAELQKAAKGSTAFVKQGDHALVPLANGVYDVLSEPFGPARGYEDEYGQYGQRVRLVRTDEKPKPARPTTPARVAKPAKVPAPAKARYFELVDGSSNKFWSISISGTSVITTYGRIGSAGSQTEKRFANATATSKAFDQLVNEKTKKGYVEKAAR